MMETFKELIYRTIKYYKKYGVLDPSISSQQTSLYSGPIYTIDFTISNIVYNKNKDIARALIRIEGSIYLATFVHEEVWKIKGFNHYCVECLGEGYSQTSSGAFYLCEGCGGLGWGEDPDFI